MVAKASKKAPVKAPAAKKPSLNELLGKMDKKSKDAPALVKVDKRPSMNLSGDVQEAFAILVGYKCVYDKIETRFENQKEQVETDLFLSWTEFVWDNKCIPSKNPNVEAKVDGRTCKGIYQVQQRFKVEVPAFDKNQTAEDVVVSLLIDLGVNEGIAQEIVQQELDFTPKRGVRNLSEVIGQEGGEDAVLRFMTMCFTDSDAGTIEVEPLTDKDRELLFYTTASVSVAEGFLDRLPRYVKSLDEFRAVLKVVAPVNFPSHMKLVCDNELATLTDIAAEMLGLGDK